MKLHIVTVNEATAADANMSAGRDLHAAKQAANTAIPCVAAYLYDRRLSHPGPN